MYLFRVSHFGRQRNSLAQGLTNGKLPGRLFSAIPPPIHSKEWGTSEVLEWAKKIPGIKETHIRKLKKQELTGGILFQLTDDDLEKCGLPLGPRKQILNEIQKLRMDNPEDSVDKFDIRQFLLSITDRIHNSNLKSVNFQFQKYIMGSWEPVETFVNSLLEQNFKSWSQSISDKQRWYSFVVYGASGVGKTRFCHELPSLIKTYITTESLHKENNIVQKNQTLVNELIKRLDGVKTLYMNIGFSGEKISDKEIDEVSSDVMLAIRVAHGYWFKEKNFDEFRSGILQSPRKHNVTLKAVLNQILKEQDAPKILFLILDEFQLLAKKSLLSKDEMLAKSLNRALMEAIITVSFNKQTFVLSTFCGTGYTCNKLQLEPTLYPTERILLPPLPLTQMKQISDQMSYYVNGRIITGELWSGIQFDDLLSSLGGLPRAVEAIEQTLEQKKYSNPRNVNYEAIYVLLQRILQSKSSGSVWMEEAGLLPYMAVSGCATQSKWRYTPKSNNTIKNVEESGSLQLRVVDSYFVINLPLIFITDAFTQSFAYTESLHSSKYMEMIEKVKVFNHTQESFEDLSNLIFALRFNVACELALLNKNKGINARQYFCGVYCGRTFYEDMGSLTIPNEFSISTNGAHRKWVWIEDMNEKTFSVPEDITTDDGKTYRITDFDKLELIRIGGQNLFDGLLKLTNSAGDKIMIWIDAKYSVDSDTYMKVSDLEPLIEKRDQLEEKLPGYKHFLLVVSNRSISKDFGQSPLYELILNTPRAAMICANNFPMAFSSGLADFILRKKQV